MFNGLEYVRPYIDDLLIISNKFFEDHINKLVNVLSKLNQKDLIQKSPYSPGMS